MKLLLLNLKHYYQSFRFLITWLPFVFLMVFWGTFLGVDKDGDSLSAYFMFFLMSGLLGNVITQFRLSMFRASFLYTLPGHQKIVRNELFIIGFILLIPYSIIMTIRLEAAFLVIIPCFTCLYAMYLLGSLSVFRRLLNPLFMVLFFAIVLGNGFTPRQWRIDMSRWIESNIITNYSLIPLYLAIACFAWICWNKLKSQQIYIDIQNLKIGINYRQGPFDIKNILHKKINHSQGEDKTYLNDNSSFFLQKIRNVQALNVWPLVWGNMYKQVDLWKMKTLELKIRQLLLWLFISAASFYINDLAWMLFIFLSFMMTLEIEFPVRSQLLFDGGRRERFLSTLYSSFILSLILMVIIALVIAASYIITPLLPMIPMGRSELMAHSLAWWYILVPLFIVPIQQTLVLYLSKTVVHFLNIIVFCVFFAPLTTGFFFKGDEPVQSTYSVYIVISLIVAFISWSCFVQALKHITVTRDLLSPKAK